MDKKQKEQREARRHQEDVALQRGLLWVLGAAVLEGLLMLVDRFYIRCSVHEVDLAYGIYYVLICLRIAGPVLALAAVVWALLQAKKGGKTALPVILALAGGAVGICAHVAVKFQSNGMSMLFWLVIAWAVLAMVYHIYQREFFLAAAGVGMSIMGLWFVRYTGLGLECVLCMAGILAVILATLWLKKRDGAGFLEKGAGYPVVLVSCLAGLAAVAGALVAGSTVAYYLVFVMLAWMFALFVYYTVKLM